MNQPDREQILAQVVATIAEVAGVSPSQIKPDTELITDLNLDSLAMYEIVIDLEESFDLQISDSDIDQIRTLEDAVHYILAARGT